MLKSLEVFIYDRMMFRSVGPHPRTYFRSNGRVCESCISRPKSIYHLLNGERAVAPRSNHFQNLVSACHDFPLLRQYTAEIAAAKQAFLSLRQWQSSVLEEPDFRFKDWSGYTRDMREQLSEAMAEAIEASKPAPSNEQETCFRIIDPLLKAMGYTVQEIKIQDRDNAKQKPDYTILPSDPDFTWFLEAKAWDVTLADNHANQAVNYANTQGKRWVVLSNGRDWRLYDNHTHGTVEVKLACVARLGEEGFLSFLEALSKFSIQQGKLEGFVRNQRLYSCLSSQLTRPDSDVVKAMVRALKSVHGLGSVTGADVIGFLHSHPSGIAEREESLPSLPAPPPPATEPERAKEVRQPERSNGQVHRMALGSIGRNDLVDFKISAVEFPDGQIVTIRKWCDLTLHVARYLMDKAAMPSTPLFVSERAKSPLVAKEHSPESQRMRVPAHLPEPYSDWLVEIHFSAADHRSKSVFMLSSAGVDANSVHISVYPGTTVRAPEMAE